MIKSVAIIGPYIGDLEQELFAFRPYAKYVTSIADVDKVYIISHYNRSFLYDWIPEEDFLPVFESLSREETKQHGYVHDDVSRSDYTQLIKFFKAKIRETHNKADIEVYTPPYIKSNSSISIYQKEFSDLLFPKININRSDYIAFIADKSKDFEEVYHTLKDMYDIIVIGSMSNGIEQENVILKSPDYFINGYTTMLNYINNAKLILTNCPIWAMVGNLMKKHMIFCGDTCSQYKPEGIYGFDNYNAVSVDVGKKAIIEMVRYKYEKI